MVPGKFKDKCPNNPILEFVGLRSKMYSILPKEGEKKATAKGVNQRITRREIKHMDYRNWINTSESGGSKFMKRDPLYLTICPAEKTSTVEKDITYGVC